MTQSSKAPSYRHWLEYPVLIFTLFVRATAPAVILLFFLARWGGTITITLEAADGQEELTLILLLLLALALSVFAVFAAIGLITLWTARRRLNQLRRGSVRVSANQFPALHRLARQVGVEIHHVMRVHEADEERPGPPLLLQFPAMPAQPSTIAPLRSRASASRAAASIRSTQAAPPSSSASTGMSVPCTPRQREARP